MKQNRPATFLAVPPRSFTCPMDWITILSKMWPPVVAGGLVSALISGIFGYVSRRQLKRHDARIEHEFNTVLANHKASLEREADAIRTRHQQRLHDFTLFTTRKHAVYAELYRRFRVAMVMSDRIQGVAWEWLDSWWQLDEPEMRQRLAGVLGVPKDAIDQQLPAALMLDGDERLRRLRDIADRGAGNKALRLRQRAIHYYYANEVFLSQAVRHHAIGIVIDFQHMQLLQYLSEKEFSQYAQTAYQEIDAMRTVIQLELNGGGVPDAPTARDTTGTPSAS